MNEHYAKPNTQPRALAAHLCLLAGSTPLLLSSVALLSSASSDPYERTKIGAGIGAVSGLNIGNQVGGSNARLLGAAIGVIAGGAVGSYQVRVGKERPPRSDKVTALVDQGCHRIRQYAC